MPNKMPWGNHTLLSSDTIPIDQWNNETVILKQNCTFQTSSMVSMMSKYQLFKKDINFFTPGFYQNYYISQENKDITCSPFDMACVTPG